MQTKYIAQYNSVLQIREELHCDMIASFLIVVVSAIKLRSPAFTGLSDLAAVVIFYLPLLKTIYYFLVCYGINSQLHCSDHVTDRSHNLLRPYAA
jgi:hypothetical protein